MEHELKTWCEPFAATWHGLKLFEYRKNDRDFQVWDTLYLREWNPKTERYSKRAIKARVSYILKDGYGLPDGYCIMSLDGLVRYPSDTRR